MALRFLTIFQFWFQNMYIVLHLWLPKKADIHMKLLGSTIYSFVSAIVQNIKVIKSDCKIYMII